MTKCSQCNGCGYITHALGVEKCSVCKGIGYIEQASRATPDDAVDAQRYRWLRFEHQNLPADWYISKGVELDAEIDRQIAIQRERDSK